MSTASPASTFTRPKSVVNLSCKIPGCGDFVISVHGLQRYPKVGSFDRESTRKSPAYTAEIPVLGETISGDWFDRHWEVGLAVDFEQCAHWIQDIVQTRRLSSKQR